MGASAKTLKINIINNGGRGTKFAIDLGRNELDLVVNPPRGTIRAKSHITIYVEMVGLTEGEFYREMWWVFLVMQTADEPDTLSP